MSEKQRYTELEYVNDFDKTGKYEQECEKCGQTNRVHTQKDNYPEYYTGVYTECIKCGAEIFWNLPVN